MKKLIPYISAVVIIFTMACFKSNKDYIKDINNILKTAKNHNEKGVDLTGMMKKKEAIKEYTLAIENYNKAIKISEKNDYLKSYFSIMSGVIVITYFYRGLLKLEEKFYNEAIVDFNKILEIFPEHQAAFSKRGRSYSKINNFNNAIKDLQRAIKLLPNDPEANFYMACVYSLQKNKKDALRLLDITINYILRLKGKRESINSIRKFWVNRITEEKDLDNINSSWQFKRMLSKIKRRY